MLLLFDLLCLYVLKLMLYDLAEVKVIICSVQPRSALSKLFTQSFVEHLLVVRADSLLWLSFIKSFFVILIIEVINTTGTPATFAEVSFP